MRESKRGRERKGEREGTREKEADSPGILYVHFLRLHVRIRVYIIGCMWVGR